MFSTCYLMLIEEKNIDNKGMYVCTLKKKKGMYVKK